MMSESESEPVVEVCLIFRLVTLIISYSFSCFDDLIMDNTTAMAPKNGIIRLGFL